MINLKKLIENKSLNTKLCPAGLSPRTIPLNLYGKPWGWGKYQQTAKSLLIFPSRKIFFISSLYTTLICTCSHCCCIIFPRFRLYMYAQVMLILINQCLLNVAFNITKSLNGYVSLKCHFYYPPFQCYLENSASLTRFFYKHKAYNHMNPQNWPN